MRDPEDIYAKASDRHFELFKHFTTLDTAAALVVLALYRDLPIGIVGALWPLFSFSSSLLACVGGMLALVFNGDIQDRISAQRFGGLVFFVVAMFVLGVLGAAVGILSP